MSAFSGVILYIRKAVYGHDFSSNAFFQSVFTVPMVLSAILFAW